MPDEPTEQQIEELSGDLRTVADEILEEVRECRTQQSVVTADLASLHEEGRENSRQYQELLSELKNLREENRSLSQELKTLISARPSTEPNESTIIDPPNGDSPIPSTPTTSLIVTEPIEPADNDGHAAPIKKKRHHVI